jgi:hypothetical protein
MDDPDHIPPGRATIAGKILKEAALGRDIIELSGHARLQMGIRDISEDDVLKTIREPTATGLPTQPGRERVRRDKTARVAIDVVYELLPDRVFVVTAIKKERRLVERRRRKP